MMIKESMWKKMNVPELCLYVCGVFMCIYASMYMYACVMCLCSCTCKKVCVYMCAHLCVWCICTCFSVCRIDVFVLIYMCITSMWFLVQRPSIIFPSQNKTVLSSNNFFFLKHLICIQNLIPVLKKLWMEILISKPAWTIARPCHLHKCFYQLGFIHTYKHL